MDNNDLVRPVACWYCHEDMHYTGQPRYEPEVRVTVEHDNGYDVFYVHVRCWNEWQKDRPE